MAAPKKNGKKVTRKRAARRKKVTRKRANGYATRKRKNGNGINGKKTIRRKNGNFAPGTAGGPGRPSRAVEQHYQDLLREAVSDEDWIEIIACAVDEAKRGGKYGIRAREFIADRLLGRPRMPLEVTDPDSIKQERLHLLREAWSIKQNKKRAEAIASIVAVVGEDGMPTLDKVMGRA